MNQEKLASQMIAGTITQRKEIRDALLFRRDPAQGSFARYNTIRMLQLNRALSAR
jgi:hypothetical protein